jgi:SAM-dependent methyltransferase
VTIAPSVIPRVKRVTDAFRMTRFARDGYRAARYRLNRRTRAANASMRGSPDGLPLPPLSLVYRVSGHYDLRAFFESGRAHAADIRRVVETVRPITSHRTILDFGCGCGRILRHWAGLNACQVSGTDHDEALIAWCRRSLPFASVARNELAAPLRYDAGAFDLVYAVSVFTHLSEDAQGFWMGELSRILRSGGLLLFTIHGAGYAGKLTPAERARFDAGDLVVQGRRYSGRNACAAYHPASYVQERLLPAELELLRQDGTSLADSGQEIVLARRR